MVGAGELQGVSRLESGEEDMEIQGVSDDKIWWRKASGGQDH